MTLPLLLDLLLSLSAPAQAAAQAPAKGSPEALAAITDEVIKDVEKFRGLTFKRPVPKHVRSKEEVRRFVLESLDKEMPPAVWVPREKFYKLLGLVPADVDLRKSLEEVFVEQIGGFYDPDTGEFNVVGSFGPTLDRFVVVHELTHALDDQHYDLKGILERVRGDEDRSFAASAVAEGSGMLVANSYVIGRALRAKPEEMNSLLEEMKGMEAIQAKQLGNAPPYVQRMLLLPYLEGMKFLQKGFGTLVPSVKPADFDRAFRNLPRSSEQVLHPEKYWVEGALDDPVAVTLPDFAADLGAGWSTMDSSTLGEMYAALLSGDEEPMPELSVDDAESVAEVQAFFARSWTNDAAEGWGGDRFVVLANGERLAGVWFTVWDSTPDAEAFEKAFRERHPAPEARRDGARFAVAVGSGVEKGTLEKLVGRALKETQTKAPAAPAPAEEPPK